MADACCNQFGGRISIEIGGKRYAPTDGEVELSPTNRTIEAMANGDGSAAYTMKPKLYGADLTLRNGCGIKWDNEMLKCKVNVTIVEEDNNRTHLFTGARLVGEPTLSLSDGSVKGIKIAGPRYQVI